MSQHAHINLLEVEDSVKGRADGVEGRFGRGPMGARDIGVAVGGPKPEGGDGETAPVTWPA